MATLGSVAGCTALWCDGAARRRGRRWCGASARSGSSGRAPVPATGTCSRLAIPSILPPPMPFKVFVLSAGVFGMPWRRFVVTLFVARGLRYSFWGDHGRRLRATRRWPLLRRFDAGSPRARTGSLVALAVIAGRGLAPLAAAPEAPAGGAAAGRPADGPLLSSRWGAGCGTWEDDASRSPVPRGAGRSPRWPAACSATGCWRDGRASATTCACTPRSSTRSRRTTRTTSRATRLVSSSIREMLRTLDPHSNFLETKEYSHAAGAAARLLPRPGHHRAVGGRQHHGGLAVRGHARAIAWASAPAT